MERRCECAWNSRCTAKQDTVFDPTATDLNPNKLSGCQLTMKSGQRRRPRFLTHVAQSQERNLDFIYRSWMLSQPVSFYLMVLKVRTLATAKRTTLHGRASGTAAQSSIAHDNLRLEVQYADIPPSQTPSQPHQAFISWPTLGKLQLIFVVLEGKSPTWLPLVQSHRYSIHFVYWHISREITARHSQSSNPRHIAVVTQINVGVIVISVKNALIKNPVTLTFDLSTPKPYHFQDIPKSFPIPTLNTLGSTVFEFCSGQTNKQANRRTRTSYSRRPTLSA